MSIRCLLSTTIVEATLVILLPGVVFVAGLSGAPIQQYLPYDD